MCRTLPEVDRNNIFVLGHSLGGLAAAYVAERAPLRGLILAATAGRMLDLVIRDQIKAFNAAGKDAQVFQADFDALEALTKARSGSEARLFPSLTHIFTATDGPADAGAILEPAHLATEVVDTIAG